MPPGPLRRPRLPASCWPLAVVLLLLVPGAPRLAAEEGVLTSRPGARVLPLPRAEGVFHFAVFGDRTGGPPEGLEVLRQAVRDTNLLDPDLVLTVGDLVQGYNAEPAWRAQMEEYRAVMAGLRMPWFPVAGNHDIYWRGAGPAPAGHHEAGYEQHFGPLWYAFRHKNAGFVVLYSDEGDRARNQKGWDDARVNRFSDEQLAWLAATLPTLRDLDHVFVFLHHPRWLADTYPGSNWDAVHALLAAAGNVSAVFAGHIHRQRYDGERDGIAYHTLATTGGATPMDAPGSTFVHHLNVVTVRRGTVAVASLPVGRLLDPRAMTPARWRDIDRLRALVPAFDAALDLDAQGLGRGRLRVTLENPCDRPVEVALTPRTGRDGAWWFTPDHAHLALAPGATGTVELAWQRTPPSTGPGDDVPFLALEADYLALEPDGAGARVRLPERRVPLPLALPAEPAGPVAPEDERALRLAEAGACLEVTAGALPLPDGPFTLEGWLRADAYDGRRGFLCKTESSEYGLFVSEGAPSFSVHLAGRYATAAHEAPLLSAGVWHHLAGVFDGAEVRLYLDGRLVARAPGRGPRTTNLLPLLVGADPDKGGGAVSGLAGSIDEVRLSTGARYTGETFVPARRHAPDGDTFLLLHLDRAFGPLTPDAGPGRRHALARGRVAYEPAAR